jgi:hypothetical protein
MKKRGINYFKYFNLFFAIAVLVFIAPFQLSPQPLLWERVLL